ncbi:MAG: membrane protein insertase YidC [Acidobacteriota bacterium]
MERRALLAALLSGVVLVLWYAFVMPPQAERNGKGATGTAVATPAAAPASTLEATREAETAPPAEPSAPAPAAVRGSAEEVIELAGEGWRAAVAARGGKINSLILGEYKDDKGAPLELAGGVGILGIAGEGPWDDDIWAVERTGEEVRLRWSDGQGNWVDKRFAPAGGRYALAVEVAMGGAPARLGLLVGAGVGSGAVAQARSGMGVAGAVLQLDGKLDRIKAEKIEQAEERRGKIGFAGVEDQYFLVVMLPDADLDGVRLTRRGEGAGAVAAVALTGREGKIQGTLYAGPKEHRTLVGYGRGLEETLSFGFFGLLSVGALGALRWIHSWAGNWGVAIIVLTAGIRVLLFPLTHKSTVAMRRMQALQPKMKAIQERYQERAKRDPQVRARMNQEVMGLYKQEGVNPLGGCLPTLVQLPILWALYTLFANAIELRHAPLALWIRDLSLKDPTYITPVLMTATMVIQQRMTPQVGDPAQRKIFMLMPFIFGIMFMNFPAGLVLYWLVNNVLTIGQQMLTERMLSGTAKTA